MNDTHWMTKGVGTLGQTQVDNVSDDGEAGVLLLHGGRPDWVRHPVTGQQLRVEAMFDIDFRCPSCGDIDRKRMLQLAGDGGPLFVCECKACGRFSFFTLEGGTHAAGR
jgi:hypothetical protein